MVQRRTVTLRRKVPIEFSCKVSRLSSLIWLRLELLLRFPLALQTSRVHLQLDIRTLSMDQFFISSQRLIAVSLANAS